MFKHILPLIFAVSPPLVYNMARRRLSKAVPLNELLGIEIVSVGDGVGEARLPFRPDVTNHIGSMHATAIFGVAEAASGCAMTGAFAPLILNVRPVAASAEVKFMKIARSSLIATAKTATRPDELRARLTSEGKIAFDVAVDVRDDSGAAIASVTVVWHLAIK